MTKEEGGDPSLLIAWGQSGGRKLIPRKRMFSNPMRGKELYFDKP